MKPNRGIARWRIVARVKEYMRASNHRLSQLEEALHLEREKTNAQSRDITRLEAEIDELRADNVRVAELLDLAEQQLTPNLVHLDSPIVAGEQPR
jgi:cell shape-determining protein MreC